MSGLTHKNILKRTPPIKILKEIVHQYNRREVNRKHKNLFDLFNVLPRQGVGFLVKRKSWPWNCFFKVTKVNVLRDGRHGKAWGVYFWNGTPQFDGKAKRIHGAHKRNIWRYISEEKVDEWEQKEIENRERLAMIQKIKEQNAKALMDAAGRGEKME